MRTTLFLVAFFFFLNVKSQIYTISSPQNFTLGCASKTFCTININPPPLTYTLTGPSGSSIVITGTTSSQGSPTVGVPGNWVIVASNGTTQAQVPFSILQNTFAPDVSVAMQTQTLNCYVPSVTLDGSSNTQNTTFSWFSQGSASVTTHSVIVSSNPSAPFTTLVNTFTLVVTDTNNACKSQTVVPIYQNLSSPTLIVVNQFSCPDPTIDLSSNVLSFNQNLTFSWTVPSTASVSGVQSPTLTTNLPGTYIQTVKDNSTGCSSHVEIDVAGCDGILKNKKGDFEISIFPNPTSGLINLRTENNLEKIKLEIYNSLGQLVLKQTIDSENTSLNLMNEGPGIYSLHLIENGEIRFTSKIIKR